MSRNKNVFLVRLQTDKKCYFSIKCEEKTVKKIETKNLYLEIN